MLNNLAGWHLLIILGVLALMAVGVVLVVLVVRWIARRSVSRAELEERERLRLESDRLRVESEHLRERAERAERETDGLV